MFLCKLKESFEDNSSEEMEEKCFSSNAKMQSKSKIPDESK